MIKQLLLCLLCGLLLHCKNSDDGTTAPASTNTPTTSTTTSCATAVANDSITMVCVPANSNGFSQGYAGVATPVHTVPSITAFAMAKFEVKYADWQTVKTYGTGNGYTFANAGVQGSTGGGSNQHPVTTINWRDAIVWCNAASQKDGLTPVYYTDASFSTVLKTSTNTASVNATAGSEDNPYIKMSANGYRLPTEAEWEYAARYTDGTTLLRGDAPSGWTDNNTANSTVDAAELAAVAWYNSNSGAATQPVGTKTGNALGIFDMSGNVSEWVAAWNAAYTTSSPFTDADSAGATSGTVRIYRGGGWNSIASNLYTATRSDVWSPWQAFNYLGFRPVRRTSSSMTASGYPWTTRTLPSAAGWHSIAFGNGVFSAVGWGSSSAATSPDGITWTGRSLSSSSGWQGVAYGNGVFVAVADGPGTTAASSSDAITWTARTLPSSGNWQAVTYGNGIFVAVANATNAAATSADGINWTGRTLPSTSFWYSVTYGNNMYVAVADGPSTIAASSPDGITWTGRTLPSTGNWRSVTYGNGVFVTVASGGSAAATSTDGITWTARTLPSSGSWKAITFGNGVFVAIASNSTNAASSTDGINWTLRTLPSAVNWQAVTYGNNLFVAVPDSSTAAASAP